MSSLISLIRALYQRRILRIVTVTAFVLAGVGAASVSFLPNLQLFAQGASGFTVEPITWNVIGLDSNNVTVGPNTFPVGIDLCNVSGGALTDITVDFIWDDGVSTSPYINLLAGSASSYTVSSLAAGTCTDVYFNVEVTRDANAYETSRGYYIRASDDPDDNPATINTETETTPQPRELYVEYLISQNRNTTLDMSYGLDPNNLSSVPVGGSMNVAIGETYTMRLNGSTATQGYEQLEMFLTLPNTVVQVNSVETVYSADTSGGNVPSPNDTLYGDACLWENDINSPIYLECNQSSLKVGGNVSVTYNVTILGPSPTGLPVQLSSMIYDFSGSSFHYNSDYDSSARYLNLVDPGTATIVKTFLPDTISSGGTSTLLFYLGNPSSAILSGYNFVDNLPAGVSIANPTNATTSGCGTPTFSPSAGDTTITVSDATVAGGGTCAISVDVTATIVGTYTNISNNLFVGATDTGNNATDDLIVTSDPPPPACVPGYPLANWDFATTDDPQGPAATTSNVTVSTDAGSGLNVSIDGASVTGTGTGSWASDFITTDAALNLANNEYFEFIIDTTNLSEVDLSFYAERTAQGPNFIQLYYGATGTEIASSVYALSTTWQQFTANITTGFNSSGNTVFRLYMYNANNNNNGHSGKIDGVNFEGCIIPDYPTLTKTYGPDVIGAGGVSTLSFTISNPNALIALTGVGFIDDAFPAGTFVNSVPNATNTCGGTWAPVAGDTSLNLTGASLAAGASCTVTVDVTSQTVPTAVSGALTNVSGFISSTETGTNDTATGAGRDTLTVLLPPEMSKSFTPSPIIENGISRLSFSIINPNISNAVAGVAFSDTLPVAPDIMLIAATPNATTTCTNGVITAAAGTDTISMTGADIPAGGSCTVSVDVTAPTAGTYTNTSGLVSHIVNGVQFDGNTASADLTVNLPNPDIRISKQVGETSSGPWRSYLAISENLPIYYRFLIENIGDVPLSPIALSDPAFDPITGCTLTDPLPVADANDDDHITTCVLGPELTVAGVNPNTATISGSYLGVPYTDTSTATYATTEITMVKAAAPTTYSAVGNVISYTFTVTNSGSATISGPVTVADDKAADETCPSLTTVGDNDNFFDPGESVVCTASYTIIAADLTAGSVTNTAVATVDGVTDTDTATVNSVSALIGVAKSFGALTDNGNGTYTVPVTLTVENLGAETLNSVLVTDNLTAEFGTYQTPIGNVDVRGEYTVENLASATLTVNAAFNGSGDLNLLDGTDSMAPGATATITFDLTLYPDLSTVPFTNQATAIGTGATWGGITTDTSTDGADPDPGGDNIPEENTPSTLDMPAIGTAKQAGTLTNNGDGTFTVPITITVENFGTEALNTVQITDDLTTEFGTYEALAANLNVKSEYTVENLTSATLAVNVGFDGSGNQNLLTGADTLAVGATASLTFDLVFYPDPASAPFTNQATASGTGASTGVSVSDISTDGTDPDGVDNDTNPDELTPTPINLPVIGVAKSAGVLTGNGDGTFTIPYTITLENFGTETLNAVQVTDNLTTEFGSNQLTVNEPGEYRVANLASPTLTVNGSFNGSSNQNLLAGANTLAVAGTATITFDIIFYPDYTTSPFTNQVTASGTGAVTGTSVSDISSDGIDPDPGGDGAPEEQSPTSFVVPGLGVAKDFGLVTDDGAGRFTTTITITVENFGGEILNNLQLTDNLTAEFGTFEAALANVDAANEYTIANLTSPTLTVNGAYDGSANQNLLSGADSLAIGATATVTFDITFLPDFNTVPFINQVVGTGVGAVTGATVTDLSTTGADPDPGGDGNPEEGDPTTITIPPIGIAKSAGVLTNNGDGTFTVPITITIENHSGVEGIGNVQVRDDLTTQFGTYEALLADVNAPGEYTVKNLTSPTFNFTINPAFDGSANLNMLTGTDTLGVASRDIITFDLTFFPDLADAPFTNQATGTGVGSVSGTGTADASTDGTDPDGVDNDNSPDENSPTIIYVPAIGTAKRAGAPTNNGDGTFTIPMTVTVENFGTEALSNVQITDDLTTEFGTYEAVLANVDTIGEYTITNLASPTLTVNAGFTGAANQNLLAGTDGLALNATATVTFDLTIFPNYANAPFTNQATGIGTGAISGAVVNDLSTDGTDPDTNNDSNPDENTPTPVALPLIGIAKTVGVLANNGNGTFTLPVTLTLENFGTEALNAVQVTDNLTAEFGTYEALVANVDAVGEYTVENLASPTLTVNAGFTGAANQNLLTGVDTLAIGGTATITFDLTFNPDLRTAPFSNQASASGTGAITGATATDDSTDGTDPDGVDNDINPDENTPTDIEVPSIGTAKSFGALSDNGDSTFTVPVTITLENFGTETLNTVQVTDDLTTEFGTYEALLANVDAVGEYTLANLASPTLTVNAGFNGAADQNLLTGVDTLAAGGTATITFDLIFQPDLSTTPFTNQATGSGIGAISGGSTSDLSTDGADPDGADNDTNPDENTPSVVDVPAIGVAKSVGVLTNNGNGTFTLPVTITVENFGTEALTNLSVSDDLSTEFGTYRALLANVDSIGEYTVQNLASGTLTVNANFNGSTTRGLLTGADTLAIGASATITFDLTFYPKLSTAPFTNQATGFGIGAVTGVPASDVSTDGADPDGIDNDTNPDEETPTSVNVPSIGIAKQAGTLVNNGDGSFTLPITLTVENFGTEVLNAVQVTDNLTAEFGTYEALAASVDALGEYTVTSLASPTLTVNAGYNGGADQNLLSGADTLAVAGTATITFDLVFYPNLSTAPFSNQATATGTGATTGTAVTDTSTDGTNPDGSDNDDNPDENTATDIDVPSLGVSKSIGLLVNNGDGTFTVPVTITLENFGTEALNAVQVTDNLTAEFGKYELLLSRVDTPGDYRVTNLASPTLTVNTNFTGSANQNLLTGTNTLAIGATASINFNLTFFPNLSTAPFTNQAVGTGTGAVTGTAVTDNSTDGADPDGIDNDTNPDEDTLSTVYVPQIGVAKSVGQPVSNGDGTFTLPVTITVENFGTETLNGVQVTDDLTTEFGTYEALVANLDTPAEYSVQNLASGTLTVNPAYNGSGDQNLLTGADAMVVGASATITFDLILFPDFATGPWVNQATGTGTGAVSGVSHSDDSTDGADPDGIDNDTRPDEDIVTNINVPLVGIAKQAGTLVNNGDGTFTQPITLTIENFGTETLTAVQVTDDLTTEFGTYEALLASVDTAGEYSVQNLTSASLTVNAGYNGSADQNLLAGTDTLAVSTTATITFDLTFYPDFSTSPFSNQATVTGTGAVSGTPITDDSTDGTDPDGGDNDENPDENTPTGFEVPGIGTAKDAGLPVDNGNGTYTTAITITVENFGTETLNALQVTDNLTTEFGTYAALVADVDTAGEYTVANVASPTLTVNAAYDGSADQNLLTGADALAPATTATITFDLTFYPDFPTLPFTNQAVGTGTGNITGVTVTDTSTDGTDPDPDINGSPVDNIAPTAIDIPLIGVAKTFGSPTDNGDGTNTLTITITVENFGTEILNGLQITDDLTTEFGTYEALVANVDAAGEYTVANIASPTLTVNAGYTGAGDQNLLTGADALAVGATTTVTFDMTYYPDPLTAPFTNQATGSGTGAVTGIAVSDLSTNGTNPDGTDGDNNPDEDDPSVIGVPVVGIAKTAGRLVNNEDGSYTVPITLTVTSYGTDPIANIQITDDLTTEFGTFDPDLENPGEYSVSFLRSTSLTVNGGFNGDTNQNLLAGTDTLPANGSARVTFNLNFVPDYGDAPYTNRAVVTGAGAYSGAPVSDTSTDGTNPDGGDGDNTPDEDVLTSFGVPGIGVAKIVGALINNDNGTFTVPVTITVENFGTEPLDDLQVTDDLAAEFGSFATPPSAPGQYSVANLRSDFSVNSGFNGASDQNLLLGTETLDENEVMRIQFDLIFYPDMTTAPFTNQALGSGTGADSGARVRDLSTQGTDPDGGDGDNSPDEDEETLIRIPLIGIAKGVVLLTDNPDATFTATFSITVENFGTEDLTDLQVTDDLTTEFGVYQLALADVNLPAEYTVTNLVSPTLTVNPSFNGSTNQYLLAGTDTLRQGESASILFDLTFYPDYDRQPFTNQATTTGVGALSGLPVKDVSTAGTDPDGVNDDAVPDEQDTTPIYVPDKG